MRKQALHLIYIIALYGVIGCGGDLNRRPIPLHPFPDAVQQVPDSQCEARRSKVQAELAYYLVRHDVQDEGYEMVARYAAMQPATLPLSPINILNIGRWRNIPRQGGGLMTDALGRIVVGNFESDTLRFGLRVTATNTYVGDFLDGMADGHGVLLAPDGTYYEGHFCRDLREGFGFSVAPDTHVRAGEWRKDKYMGERMNYTSERIYGIDISRYQHGKGRKKYPILWQRLRISHLGSLSRKRISGQTDYPVSFIFIKSTESTSIRNPFYAADYAQARKRGIRIGAYHFFSTKTSATAQAQYFLRHTQFRSGDLPPVLDVEPSDRQIQLMGGPKVLFSRIRTWMTLVQQRTGVKPILYVSQMFVNKYLAKAPDLKQNYNVWIARYGEFKPDVKLSFWQLSPDGRVNGIHGEVDINVFNGYRQQFDDFLEEATIK